MPSTLAPLRFCSPASTPLASAFRQASHAHLDAGGDHRFADAGVHLKTGSMALSTLLAYFAALHAHSSGMFSFWYILALSLVMLLAINVLHDAAHRAYFRSVKLNRIVARLIAFPLGIDPDYWTVRHVHFHHAYANVDGYDLDIEPNPFLRQTPYQRQAPQFRYQHLYWPVLAALSLPYINWVFDWADRFGRTPVGKMTLQGWRGWMLFLASKAAHFVVMLWLPWQLLHGAGSGMGTILCAYALGQMLASMVVVALILGTHWAEVEFYRPQADEALPHTWHEHAFFTCCDWASGSRMLNGLLGGLNLHLTHHLHPTLSHRHYPELACRVAEIAERYGLPYRRLSWGQLQRAQQRFLRKMGREQPIER